jgi:hypothetical protein
MPRKIRGLLSISLLAAALSAISQANTLTLSFEGLEDRESVLDYYAGGEGSLGSGPGTNYGITFAPNAIGVVSADDGGTGNFSGAPSMYTALSFLSGTGDVMDVAAGFTGGLSFYYAAIANPGMVSIYSGLDGAGDLLSQTELPVTVSGGAGCDEPFCPFTRTSISFNGTGQSVIFGGAANQIAFDNITLDVAASHADVGEAPEPAAWMFMAAALAASAGVRRLRQYCLASST